MGFLNRLSDLLRSNINDLISRAEDPEKMLNAAIEDMQKQLVEAKSRVAMSIADEKRLEKQQEQEQSKAEEWEYKAMTAVRAGRDDLAVEALARKKEHQTASLQFQEQLDGQRGAVDELKRALTELTSKLDETRRKRTLLLARAKRAEAQRQIASTLHNKSHASAAERLDRLEARIERDEAKAEAQWEFAALGPGSYERDLAKEIEALDSGAPDEDLAALKAKVRALDAGTEQKALEAGHAALSVDASAEGPTESDGAPGADGSRGADDAAEKKPASDSAAHGA